jgi:hypothetical protein
MRYRQLAQQCLDLERVALRERARTWTRLADESETRTAHTASKEPDGNDKSDASGAQWATAK